TVHYMSPEQALGKEVDHRTDIWSLGVVLYEMATGQLPFKGEYEQAVIYSILNEQPEPIQKNAIKLSSDFIYLLNRILEKNPGERYQSVNDMLIDLKRLKRDIRQPGSADQSAFDPAYRITDHHTPRRPLPKYFRWLVLGLIFLSIGFLFWIIIIKSDSLIIPFEQIQVNRITSHGNAKGAGISSDGKYIVHVMVKKGKQSLWLRQVATGSNVEILPPSDDQIYGLTFSKDSNYIYYILVNSNFVYGDLYRLPVLGGTAIQVLGRVDSPISFSPDGKQFAFIRMQLKPISSSLIVFDTIGKKEKIIVTCTYPNYLGNWGLSWSPDGESVAAMQIDPLPRQEPNTLVNISVSRGSIESITSKRWGAINQITWLTDGSGLVISAADKSSGYFFQLWYVSYPGGKARRITSELNNYLNVGLTEDMSTILTKRSDWQSIIWTAPSNRPDQAKQISSGKYDGIFGLSCVPDGRIVYASRDWNLWIMNHNGSGQRLLTQDEQQSNSNPDVSPDGRYIVFQSWRGDTSTSRIWRMDIDGGNPVVLTNGEWDDQPQCTPDGKWVVFKSEVGGRPSIWRVPFEGGQSSQLFKYFSSNPAVSYNGKWIACRYSRESDSKDQMQVAVFSSAGGEPVHTFDISYPASEIFSHGLCWTAGDQAITYIVGGSNDTNIWQIALDGTPAVQLTHFQSKQIYAFDWSADGSKLVYARGVLDDDVVLIRNVK
ncbi:MAG: PD40 domain-containing protein, partial [Deltaproteobacteria bacterium]|nr:PD40 domain-containing protein [Deltaproteobacteria bacterium]